MTQTIGIVNLKMLQKIKKNKWFYAIISAIAAGLYAIVHTYGTNFFLVSSWPQFGMMLLFFIAFPIVVFVLTKIIVERIAFLKKFEKYSIPILNAGFFTFFIIGKTYGFNARRMLVLGCFFAVCLAIFLWKHYEKIVIFQFLLALIAFVKIPPMLYEYVTRSEAWLQQPDAIEEATFQKTPNIYVIQPDGYVNFSELGKGMYNFDNSDFSNHLKAKNFKIYDNFRSNYISTLLSNTALFTMKHHHMIGHENKGALFGLPSKIVGNNSVLSTLKNNQYKTFLLLEYPYLLMSRPTLAYDECNINYYDIPWFGNNAFKDQYDLIEPLKEAINTNKNSRNFYFIEKIAPSHITRTKSDAPDVESDREKYLDKLKETNDWLKEITDIIIQNDPNSLIVITADHGGFVGLDYYAEILEKQTDRDKIYAVFSAALAIKWPEGNAPDYDSKFASTVNLFRILFTYLSEDESYLKHLEDDKSFSLIIEDAPYGLYEYIDAEGNIVFKKHEETTKKE
ncbi:sulfatase-like hydrolase/transferase [Kordia sp.]|uniref:sulfatase-like hydrolase/transferase n=1 Tax=Kordia sp. TaxID=1965332 RepID=UPI003B5BC566